MFIMELSLSTERLMLLVVEREFDLRGKWQEEGLHTVGDDFCKGDDEDAGKEYERMAKCESDQRKSGKRRYGRGGDDSGISDNGDAEKEVERKGK